MIDASIVAPVAVVVLDVLAIVLYAARHPWPALVSMAGGTVVLILAIGIGWWPS